jgi:CelD/BcsL family acetyltransferase involved in cellulose biosynthesis
MNAQADPIAGVEPRIEEVAISWIEEHIAELDRLALAQADPTPFQSAAWILSWWRAFGSDYTPRILVARRNQELVGFAPLMLRRGRASGALEWLGTGRSDHAPLLLDPVCAAPVFAAFLAHLRQRGGWSLLWLRTLQESHRSAISGVTAGTAGVGAIWQPDDVSPRIALSGSWDEFLAGKSSKHRSNLRRLLRQANEIAQVQIECVSQYQPQLLREIEDVERHSWKADSGSLRLEGSGYGFYEAFLRAFSQRNALEVWCCRHEQRLVAYLITFVHAERVFYYNGAYRSDATNLGQGFSPGTALIASAVKSAHDRKLHSFDFLRGDEAYKALWKNEDRVLHQLVIPAPGVKGSLALLALRLRWKLREYSWAHRLRNWLAARGKSAAKSESRDRAVATNIGTSS